MNIEIKDLIGGKITREGLEKESVLRRDQKALLNKEPKNRTKEEWIESLKDRREAEWERARCRETQRYESSFEAGIALMVDRFLHFLVDRNEPRQWLEELVDEWLEKEIEGARREGDSNNWHFARALALCGIQYELRGVTDF